MKLNRTWAMAVAIVMALTLSLSGTLAYLSDTDQDINVMTLGNVQIEQLEYQRAEGVKHTATANEGDLVPFVQGQPLYPAVPKAGAKNPYTAEPTALFSWGPYVTAEGAGNGLWDDDKISNVVDKFVFVKNTGKSDAYYRTLFAFECPDGMEYGEGSDKEFMMNVNGNERFDWADYGYITVKGVRYLLMSATYNEILTPGEISRPSLLQVLMTEHCTNEHMELLGDTYEILVVSQAVQAAGFDSAEDALNTAFGEISATNHPWVDAVVTNEIGITEGGTYDLPNDVYTIDSAYFHTQKVTESVTINGNGSTVVGVATSADAFQWEGGTIPAMSAIFSSANGSKVTVNDLTFKGTMSSVMVGHYQNATYNNYNAELNNVNIVGTKVVSFSSEISPALCVYGTAVLNNCKVYDTTLSELDTDPKWPVYDMAVVNYSDTTLNNTKVGSIFVWNQAKLTVAEGSEVDTIIIKGNMNPPKYGVTIKAGATVDAIDLSAITDKTKVNFTIEDGATVGKIISNDNEYASIAAWKAAE